MIEHPTVNVGANSAEQKRYYNHVVHLASVIEEQVATNPDLAAEDMLPDIISGSAYLKDGDTCVEALRATEEEPDEFVHMLDDSDSYIDVLQAMAYKSLESDVREQLQKKDLL